LRSITAKGIDARVNNIGFQIAKISQRKEVRTSGGKKFSYRPNETK
ncbi:hypothetical protein HKBW3S09_01959, partial [Candidatus Hakubella thermalkaliphila]